jgi:transposase InsO family protein
VPAELKLRAVQERLHGTPQRDVARAFGVSEAAVTKWLGQFRKDGADGLLGRRGGQRKKPARSEPARERVVALKQKNEGWGTRRIRDVLKRFETLGVSEQTVRRILHEEGLIESPPPASEREHPPRRFERAAPNQLWQSDIFTFLHRRQERLYVCVFMDDHSRFIVGHALAHHQKSVLVMEAFERGVAAFGQPAEVLTDNGRQYTVWRGKTEFEIALKRLGIQHIRSRPQHPQTLGKVERFWKTLWDEFLGRTVFAHYVDAQHRLEHFIKHYNFHRPHQALDGAVPADRYFRAASHVRAEIERQVAANALRLALEQPPRKPFYVVGQLGDQHLSIAAGGSGLEVRVGDTSQTIPLKEDDDATRTAHRFPSEADAESTDAAMADEEDGPRRGGEEPRADGAVGPLGREAGDGGDRRGWDLARLLLSARDQGDQRDAPGAGTGLRRRFEPGCDGTASPDQGARGKGGAGRAGQAPGRAAALRAAEADHGPGEDGPGPAAEENFLDKGWAERLALLDDPDDEDAGDESAAEDEVGTGAGDELDPDPDLGWHERGPLNWDRKLAGADAASDRRGDEEHDDEGPTLDVHGSAGAADRPGAAETLRPDHGGDRGDANGGGCGPRAWDVPESLPDDLAPWRRGADRGDHTEASGETGEAGTRGSARGGERGPQGGTASGEGASSDDGPADVGGERHQLGTRAAAESEEPLGEEEARGPGTGVVDDGGEADA